MPAALIQKADDMLQHLESIHENGKSANLADKIKSKATTELQFSIFDAHTETFEDIRKLLQGIDINRLTPVEALLKLQEIKNKIQ